jgi:hypothetical protein
VSEACKELSAPPKMQRPPRLPAPSGTYLSRLPPELLEAGYSYWRSCPFRVTIVDRQGQSMIQIQAGEIRVNLPFSLHGIAYQPQIGWGGLDPRTRVEQLESFIRRVRAGPSTRAHTLAPSERELFSLGGVILYATDEPGMIVTSGGVEMPLCSELIDVLRRLAQEEEEEEEESD